MHPQVVDLEENSPSSPADALDEDCSLLSRTKYKLEFDLSYFYFFLINNFFSYQFM